MELETGSLTTLEWVGIVLAAITGVVHLVISTGFLPEPLGISFLLAGLGFLGAIVLVLLGYRRRTVYAVGIPYTAVQIVLWYVLNFDGVSDMLETAGPLGVLDKAVQIAFVLVLIALLRR
jgi:hypothetical protein